MAINRRKGYGWLLARIGHGLTSRRTVRIDPFRTKSSTLELARQAEQYLAAAVAVEFDVAHLVDIDE